MPLYEKAIVTLLGIIIGLISFSWKQETDVRKELLESVIILRVNQASNQVNIETILDKVNTVNSRVDNIEQRFGPKIDALTLSVSKIEQGKRTPVFGK